MFSARNNPLLKEDLHHAASLVILLKWSAVEAFSRWFQISKFIITIFPGKLIALLCTTDMSDMDNYSMFSVNDITFCVN
mgnify:FL=1